MIVPTRLSRSVCQDMSSKLPGFACFLGFSHWLYEVSEESNCVGSQVFIVRYKISRVCQMVSQITVYTKVNG